jgi:hypothetical protein
MLGVFLFVHWEIGKCFMQVRGKCVCICMYVYVCMYMYVSMYVSMYVCMYFSLTLFHSMFHYKRQHYMLEIAYM